MAAAEREAQYRNADIAAREEVGNDTDGKTLLQKQNILKRFVDFFKDPTLPGSGARVMRRLQERLNAGEKIANSDPGYASGREALFQLFEAVKLATRDLGLTPADLGLRDNVAVFIRELDTKVSPYLSDATDTTELYNFLRKFADNDFDETRWRSEWAALKPKLSKSTLDRIADAVKTTHTKPGGTLNVPATFDVNAEVVVGEQEGRDHAVAEKEETNGNAQDALAKELSRISGTFGGKDITAPRPKLTEAEADIYGEWHKEVGDKIEAERARIQALPDVTTDELKLKREQQDKLEQTARDFENARRDGQFSRFKELAAELKITLSDQPGYAGNKEDEIDKKYQKYIEMYARELSNRSKDDFLKKFGISEKDIEEIQPNTIYAQWERYFETTSDGKKTVLSKEGKNKMYGAVYQTMNRILSRTTVGDSPFSNDRVLSEAVNQLIWNIVEDPRIRSKLEQLPGGVGNYSAFRDFFTNTFMEARVQETNIRNFYRINVKSIIEGKATPESLKNAVREFRASDVNYVLKGYKAGLTQLAVSEFERDLQDRIAVQSGGYIPADLFAQKKVDLMKEFQYEDLYRVRANFLDRIRAMKADTTLKAHLTREKATDEEREMWEAIEDIQDWEVDRALNIAMGVSFINSMRGHDIIAMGKPPEHFKALFPFAQYFSLDKKWRVGRGGEQWKTSELLQLEIRMKEDKRGLSERVKQGWVPKKLWEKGRSAERMAMDKLIEQLNNNTLKLAQSKEDHVFLSDLFRQFSTFSLFTQGGWRIAALGDWYKKEFGQGMDDDWRAAYENLQQRVGAGARFFYDSGRVEAEVKHYILTKQFGPNYKEEQKKSVLDAVFNEYTLMPIKGKLNEKEMFKYNNDDKENTLTTQEFIEEKAMFYRGMNFKALMERSPYDFMLNIVQLEPELAKVISISKEIPGKNRKQLTAWEYYFDDSVEPFLTKVEVANKREWRQRLEARWTDPNQKDQKGKPIKENIKHIEKLAKVWHEIYINTNFQKAEKQSDGSTKYSLDQKEGSEKFYRIMSMAADKVKLKDKKEMTKEDIVYIDPTTKSVDPASEIAAEVILGDKGMVKHFAGLNEKFADGPGEEAKVGDRKFFYTVAKRWYEYDQRGVVPNTNDMKVGPMFETIGAHEEEAYARMWASNANWNEAVNGITDFDNILLRAAGSKSLNEIMDLHKKIQSLEGSLGVTGAHRLNYILATTVVRFFQQDYRARFPFPLNLFTAWGLEKEVSISVRHKSASAMQWKEETIREYMDSLLAAGYIGKDGYWTREMLEKAVGADREKYFLLNAGPSIAFLTILTVAAQFFMSSFSTYGPGAKKK